MNKGAVMGFWIGALACTFAYLIWLSWIDVRHHRPYVALSAALLASVYLGVLVVTVTDPWVALPLWPTILAFIGVEAIVRSAHRLATLGSFSLRPQGQADQSQPST